jgi:hypothetical protein
MAIVLSKILSEIRHQEYKLSSKMMRTADEAYLMTLFLNEMLGTIKAKVFKDSFANEQQVILAPNKQLVVNKSIAGTVIFIKFEVIVKELFELLQFRFKELFCRLCFVWLFAFNFIDGIVIYQLCNKMWLDVLKKNGFLPACF